MIVFREQELISLSYIWTWLQESSRETCPGCLASTPTYPHTHYIQCERVEKRVTAMSCWMLKYWSQSGKSVLFLGRLLIKQQYFELLTDTFPCAAMLLLLLLAGWAAMCCETIKYTILGGVQCTHPRHGINSELHVEQMRKWIEDTHEEEEEEDWDGSSSLL